MLFVPMLGLIGIAIAMIRRYSKASLDSPAEDMASGLLRWAIGLLSAERAEWGQAMLGELDHIDGRMRRFRFAFGCAIAALLLPPWGRAAAGVWTMIAVAVGGVGLYASVVVHYGLGSGEWVWVAILVIFLVWFLLAASALLRRPRVAGPGLVGGLFVALAFLSLSGFTFYDQIAPDIVAWHQLVIQVGVPFAVGAAGTLWAGDAVVGRRVARLAGISAGLGLFVYWNLAVAVLGAGGPPDDLGNTQFVVSDRLGNNVVFMLLIVVVNVVVGWGGAAAAGVVVARMSPATAVTSAAFTGTGQIGEAGPAVQVRSSRQTVRILVLCAVIVVAALLAADSWLRG